MSRSFSSPPRHNHRKDWVREYLTSDDETECNREINSAFDDLQITLQAMFDGEIARRVREVERKGYYTEASFIPAVKHNTHIRERSEQNELELELKPKPLFSGRRAATHTDQASLVSSSSPGSPSEFSMQSSIDMSSPSTAATTMSPEISPMSMSFPGIPEDSEYYYEDAPTPLASSSSPMPVSADRSRFPPRRSSLQAKSDIARAQKLNKVTTYPEGTPLGVNQGKVRSKPKLKAEQGDGAVQCAKPMAVLKPVRQSPRSVKSSFNAPSGTTTSAVSGTTFNKVWTPPPYPPTRPSKYVSARHNVKPNSLEKQHTSESCQQDRAALSKSISTSSLAVFNPQDAVHEPPETRKDSFNLVGTPHKRSSPPRRLNAKSDLTLVIPKHPAMGHRQLHTPSLPTNGQSVVEFEDGVKRLCYVDSAGSYAYSAIPSYPSLPMMHYGSFHSMVSASASAVPGFLQYPYSYPVVNNDARSSFETRLSHSPSWATIRSSTEHEIIVDPNGFLSGPPRPNALCKSAPKPSSTESTPSKTKPPRPNRPEADDVSESPVTSPVESESTPILPRERYGMEMERAPQKAIRMMGAFNASADVETKDEKERKKARKKKKMDEVLEVVSNVLALG